MIRYAATAIGLAELLIVQKLAIYGYVFMERIRRGGALILGLASTLLVRRPVSPHHLLS